MVSQGADIHFPMIQGIIMVPYWIREHMTPTAVGLDVCRRFLPSEIVYLF